MAGNNERGIIIQDRDIALFQELATMRVADREQMKIVAGFGSTTRANARLLGLVRAGFLRRFFLGTRRGSMKALYALSAKGARLIDVPVRGPQRRKDAVLAADLFVEHQLAVNDVYCALKFRALPPMVLFRRWISFFAPIVPNLPLIPDGYVELDTPAGILAAFLEMDLGHERGPVWGKKIREYLQFATHEAPDGNRVYRPFRVLVIAPTERRVQSIRKTVAASTQKIFWFASLEAIQRSSLFASVWLRPTGEERLPLIKEQS